MERGLGVLTIVGLLLIVAQPASAAFFKQRVATASFGAVTLTAPTGLTATANGNPLSCAVQLRWSSPAEVNEVLVQRRLAGIAVGAPVVVSSPTSSLLDVGLTVPNLYTWTLQGRTGTWTSPITTISSPLASTCA